MISDMMRGFTLYQPSTLRDALKLLDRFGDDGWALAGGNDSLSWFKDRIRRPEAVIELAQLDELRGIREAGGGIEIGALTTLADLERSALIQQHFGVLADAARRVASPQIRNVSTLGGNVCQDARCWYYRDGLDCYRAGGNTCYADTPTGMDREHTLFGADRCVAVSPSDTAPALVALEAEMVIRNSDGERVVAAEDFFVGPGIDVTRMTVMEPQDILTAVRIPDTWAGTRFYFEKVADRQTWDFALVNVASAMVLNDGVIERVRVVCGGVEAVPRRLEVVEAVVTGEKLDEEIAELAGQSAVRGARPLNYNHFKVSLMQALVKRAIRGA